MVARLNQMCSYIVFNANLYKARIKIVVMFCSTIIVISEF